MKTSLLTILILTLLSPWVMADGDAGFAGAYLRSGIGARPLGMGGAYTAIAEGPEATYYNPAGLGFDLKIGGSFSYKTLSLDRHLGHVSVSFPIRNEAAMAASWVNAGVSNLVGRGSSRQITGDIANNQNAFSLSFAKAVDSALSVGGTLRYLQEKLDQVDVFTVGVDLGFLFRYRQMLSAGFAVQNLGSNYRWDSSEYWSGGRAYDEKFPAVMKLGVAGHFLQGALIPVVDFEKSDKMGFRFRAGAEYWFVRKMTVQVEDEYEEGKFIDVQQNTRWAGLRLGLDRGSPTFGGTFVFHKKNFSAAIEYAYLVGRQGTEAGHIFTLRLGM